MKNENSKLYDLEERTYFFAKNVRELIRKIPICITNIEDCKQLTRSSGSVGANYIEASESLSKKDFYHRIKICRKEAKESRFWLKLVFIKDNIDVEEKRRYLIQEAFELTKIFGSIVNSA